MSAVKTASDVIQEHVGALLSIANKLAIENEKLRRGEVEMLAQLTVARLSVEEHRTELVRLRKLVEQRDAMISELREMKDPTKPQANR